MRERPVIEVTVGLIKSDLLSAHHHQAKTENSSWCVFKHFELGRTLL